MRATDQARRSREGNAAEALVERHNAICERAGLGTLWRVGTPSRALGGDGRGGTHVVFTGPSTVDYLGVLCDGRALAVEVKRVELPDPGAPPWRLSFARVEPQQASCLSTMTRAGGLGLLVLVVGGVLYRVPWAWVEQWQREGKRSVTEAMARPWRVGARPYLEHFVQLAKRTRAAS